MTSDSHYPQFPRYLGNYELGPVLGSGVSGSTFRAQHVITGQIVALKMQPENISYPTNCHERTIYPLLQGGKGMPTLWASGVLDGWDYLAIDLLGSSLDSLYRRNGKAPMDMRSVLSIAVQVISRLQFMHSRGVLHRDVQLGNTTVGLRPNEQTLYMIDFGFSKRYIDPKSHKHVANRTQRDFIGNYWFSSVNVHCRAKTCSRRDDLEAAALMFIHLLTPGGLPWTRNGVPRDDAAHDRLKREKRDTTPEELCRGLPDEFCELLQYCRSLKYHQQPDYEDWKTRFRELGEDLGYGDVEEFIWPPPPVSKVRAPTVPSKRAPKAQRRTDENMENILHELARLHVNPDRPVLGDKKNLQPTQPPQRADAGVPKKAGRTPGEVIVVSSESEEDSLRRAAGPIARQTKAVALRRLTQAVGAAADNARLGALVAEFAGVLERTGSRTLTREGFGFLDALHKQLADPSVFIVPLRTSQRRSAPRRAQEAAAAAEAAAVPMGAQERRSKLWALKTGVAHAQNNRTLAGLVAEFGTLTDKVAGKKLTKDGVGFLQGVAERLKVVS
ncbi:kinase-like domain-containing protein [Amylostereum chailletii]|nr:kinase-like domain-containing protein [Amylostereum chailletii]